MQTPKDITKLLTSTHALGSNHGRRNALEHEYYDFHRQHSGAGKNLRGKYRPEEER